MDDEIKSQLSRLSFTDIERSYLDYTVKKIARDHAKLERSSRQALTLQLDQISQRLMRLTDAYLDGSIEQDLFEERKGLLLFDKKEVEESIRLVSGERGNLGAKLKKFLEQAETALLSYSSSGAVGKREIIEMMTSNRMLHEKSIVIKLSFPFSLVGNREPVLTGCPARDTNRSQRDLPSETNSLNQLLSHILKWLDNTNDTPHSITKYPR